MFGHQSLLRQTTNSSTKTMNYFQNLNFKIMTILRNSVQLIGRLGKEPEIKTFDSGTKKASFSLATNENYYNNM